MLKLIIPTVFLFFLFPKSVKSQETFFRYISFQENLALPDLVGKRSMESVLKICKSRRHIQVELIGNPGNDLGRRQFAFVEKKIRTVKHAEITDGEGWSAGQVSGPGQVAVRLTVLPRPKPRIERVKSQNEVDELLAKMAPEVQKFSLDPGVDHEIDLESGSRLFIPKNSFILEKEAATVELEVVEYQSPGDMITGGLPTMTKDELLVTGGSMRVEARADGVPVELKDNHKAKVFFAQDKKPKTDEFTDLMKLYQGEIDGDGKLVWGAPRSNSDVQVLEPEMSLEGIPVEPLVQPEGGFRDIFGGNNDALAPQYAVTSGKGSRGRRRFGFAFPLRLGYINCDRPVGRWMGRNRVKPLVFVNMKVNVPNPEEHRCYTRLHDTKTVALGLSKKKGGLPEFYLPRDRRITIIAVKIEDGEPWLAMAVTKVSKSTYNDLVWKKTTEERLSEVLAGVEW